MRRQAVLQATDQVNPVRLWAQTLPVSPRAWRAAKQKGESHATACKQRRADRPDALGSGECVR